MRDINRIPMVLSAVEQLWKQYPDMRFFQFMNYMQELVNAYNRKGPDTDLFYLEDDKLLETLYPLINMGEEE